MCRQASVPCAANLTKAVIAGRVVDRARALKAAVAGVSCLEARSLFDNGMGSLVKYVLRDPAEDSSTLAVPWHSLPVRVVVLKSVLDSFTIPVLRGFASSFDAVEKVSAYRKDQLMTHIVACLELVIHRLRVQDRVRLQDRLIDIYKCDPPASLSSEDLLLCVLDAELPEDLLVTLMTASTDPDLRSDERSRDHARAAQLARLRLLRDVLTEARLGAEWPQKVPRMVKIACMSDYHKATAFAAPGTCCSCGRRRIGQELVTYRTLENLPVDLDQLRCNSRNPWLETRAPDLFVYPEDPTLDGLMFCKDGLRFGGQLGTELDLCFDCNLSLRSGSVPKFALANGLYRGELPDYLRDLTWVEEQVCALHVGSTNVTRLFGSSDPRNPFVFYGNTCAHPQNVLQTMEVLPRTVGDVADNIAVIFVGPGTYRPTVFEQTFRVRRLKIMMFLRWLKINNKLYQNVPIDEGRLAAYPEDGALPGIGSRVVHDERAIPERLVDEETAAFEEHPALANVARSADSGEGFVFLEALGLTDATSDSVPAHTFEGAALINLLPNGMRPPDLTLHRGSRPVGEYNNHDYFPGLFPTLFPLGIGGLEDHASQTHRVGFQTHASYLLDLADRSFAYHRSFVFMVVNIMQRRKVHLETRFRVKSSKVAELAAGLESVSSDQIKRVGLHLSTRGAYDGVPEDDRNVLELLKLVEAVAAKVPGGHATKVTLRRNIYSFMRHFGVPHVFLTLNPSPVHSPVFQLMFGDTTVDLTARYPRVLDSMTRSIRVAKDPTAAADFFDLSIRLVFEHLLGWDFSQNRSTERGGILGRIECFAGSVEMTGRHIPHGHFVIRLLGGLNPAAFHEKMEHDEDFQSRFFQLFEGMIRHHLPDVYYEPDPNVNPKQQRPPRPPDFAHRFVPSANGRLEPGRLTAEQSTALDEWDLEFESEVKIVGETVQRHAHKAVCKAYGFKGDCRFLFPHEPVHKSSYDVARKSVIMQCLDPWVNYFNPEIMVSCRFNHDIKNILSGRSAQAAVCYIAGYITKQDVNTHQVLNMMSDAVMNLELRPPADGQRVPVQTLIHKCLAQLTRNQTLHAQRAARYIRGRDDFFLSHDMVALMSGMLMRYVKTAYSLRDVEPHGEEHPDVSDDDEGEGGAVQPEPRDAVEEDEVDPYIQIYTDTDGRMRYSNQVEDYVYRDVNLRSYSFYDFVRTFSIVSLKGAPQERFGLRSGHSRSTTHCIRFRDAQARGIRPKEFVPTFMGCSVPRRCDTAYYKLFCLAHFKPFGLGIPLIAPGHDISRVFRSYQFSSDAKRRMDNWEAIHECEDERDAERLKRQSAKGVEHGAIAPFGGQAGAEDGFVIDPAMIPEKGYHPESFDFWSSLQYAGWFAHPTPVTVATEGSLLRDDMSEAVLKENWKEWRVQLREQEQAVRSLGSTVATAVIADANDASTSLGSDPLRVLEAEPSSVLREAVVPKLTMDIAEVFAEKYTLNAEQKRAYRLIVRSLIARVADGSGVSRHGSARSTDSTLRLILHGPGGTGKTHCLKPLQDLLDAVGMQSAVVRVAPTGTAASLIDGRTLHSALKLKVRRARGSGDAEVLELDWNASDRKQIEEVFGPAHIVLLDEFSMASLKLLAQLDAGTRMAKQCFDEFFGGMAVVLCGDLCQYAPVMEKAVYWPVSNLSAKNPTAASLNRMGRLAYKSFTHVIEFSSQQRMIGDPLFAAAVNRLRVRECVPADVRMFNTRVMKSATRPDGVDMSTPEMSKACVISATNRTRVQINAAKTKSLGAALPSYVEVSAGDTLKGARSGMKMTAQLRSRLLDLQLPPSQSPGRLNYFTGMPVIMRRRNLSVGLRATNGAQGTLRQILCTTDEFGENVPRLALIEIPDSAVDLSRLRPGIFPVAPQTSVFSVILKNEASSSDERLSVSRSQLAVEPAFCITGHIAQGRTLPKVVTDPATRRSGFYSYVSISRARCLDDIVFVRDVVLDDLNEPLPQPLRFELLRLSVLAHNTAVLCGDSDAPLKDVPVHEMERSRGATIRLVDSSAANPGRKRKRVSDSASGEAEHSTATVKRRRHLGLSNDRAAAVRNGQRNTIMALNRRTAELRKAAASASGAPLASERTLADCDAAGALQLSERVRGDPPPARGPLWDSVRWSCAYDATFMALRMAWKQMSPAARAQWRTFSSVSALLSRAFEALDGGVPDPHTPVELYRDRLRQLLNLLDPISFPAGAGMQADLFQMLQICSRTAAESDVSDIVFDVRYACTGCGAAVLVDEFYLASNVDALDDRTEFALGSWLSARLFEPAWQRIDVIPPCCPGRSLAATFENLPPLFVLCIHQSLTVSMRTRLTLPSVGGNSIYRLVGVVYVTPWAPAHFSVRLLEEGAVRFYDGQLHSGVVQAEGTVSDELRLEKRGDNKACALVYART